MSGFEFQEEDKREYRRRRRIRNQILAYVSLVLILAVVSVGGYFGIKVLSGVVEEKQQQEQMEEALAAAQQVEEEMTEVSEVPEETVEETVVETVEEYTEEDLLNEVVESCISEMSLEDRVAGLFIVTPEALTGVDRAVKAGDGTKEALEKYPVGGLIYFKQNIQSKDQITEMLANTTAMSKYPIFLAVDEEGDSVARVADALKLDKIDSAASLGETGNADNAYEAYKQVGTYLMEYGFNLNFAPVADVLTNPDNDAIGKRSFGSDADIVSSMVASSVKGLEETGVTACIKHFPGQGDADGDTHDGLATTDKTLEQLRETELKPFAAGAEAGAQMIMVGHIAVPSITGDNTPASLSKDVVTDILREEMGYNGVVITDALNMSAISEYYDSAQAAVMALKAGADMVLMPEDFEAAYEGVLAAVKDGTINEARINDSLARVYKIKYKETVDK
ncbi:MAG: beta-N-acetylhexosaminidase [Lachnospiraceae bacterium]|nr:beta-N-acetylhexosaminidase [Lachnospiraceae bacterium]